jgi:hypothetical protein
MDYISGGFAFGRQGMTSGLQVTSRPSSIDPATASSLPIGMQLTSPDQASTRIIGESVFEVMNYHFLV